VQEREVNMMEVTGIGKGFLNRIQKERLTNGLHEIKKLLHNKRNGL
jgi:hypothetical protein